MKHKDVLLVSERKIIQMSDTSLGITLPSDWLRANDLKAGDSVKFIIGIGTATIHVMRKKQ